MNFSTKNYLQKLFFASSNCAVFILIALSSFSQTLNGISQQIEGLSININGRSNALYLNDGTAIYVSGKQSLMGTGEEHLIKIDSNLHVLWKSEDIDGFLFAAKFGNNIIAFSTNDWKKNTAYFIKSIHASIINISTGKFSEDKDVYEIKDKLYSIPFLHCDVNGNFQYLQIRYSKQNKLIYFRAKERETNLQATTKIELLTFKENLDVNNITTLNTTGFSDKIYENSITNNAGDLFVAFWSNNSLEIDKYNSAKQDVTASLKENLPIQNELNENVVLQNNNGGNKIFAYLQPPLFGKDYNLYFGEFDFDAQKVNSDKTNGSILTTNKHSMQSVIGITSYKNNNIILTEEKSTTEYIHNGDAETTFNYGDLHVVVCDANFKLIKELIIKKEASVFVNAGMESSYKLLNNKLYVFANTKDGLLGMSVICAAIDLDQLTTSQTTLKNKEAKGIGNISPTQIIWFNTTALAPYIIDRSLTSTRKFDHIFQKIDF